MKIVIEQKRSWMVITVDNGKKITSASYREPTRIVADVIKALGCSPGTLLSELNYAIAEKEVLAKLQRTIKEGL